MYGNPLRYVDPSGHDPHCGPDGIHCGVDPTQATTGWLLGPQWNNNSGSASSGGGGNSNSGSQSNIGLGIFTDDEMNAMGIYCGQNVSQTVCDVYTNTTRFNYIGANVNFTNNTTGSWIANGLCWLIYQGCTSVNSSHQLTFSYTGTPDHMYWNRFSNEGMLFKSHWTTAMYLDELVAYETFPLRGGRLGYGSVYLKPTAVDGAIQWSSIGMKYETPRILGGSLGVTFPVPPVITFETRENGFSNMFVSVGTFQMGEFTLGTINIWGYDGAMP